MLEIEATDPTTIKVIESYLKQPYTRMVTPETDGTFRGEILEFPGCIATGDSPSEAYDSLEEAAKDWLELALKRGQHVPAPLEASEFSGRLVLRLPRGLHKKVAHLAEREGVSLNHLIVTSLAECVGERAAHANFRVVNLLRSWGTLTGNKHTLFVALNEQNSFNYVPNEFSPTPQLSGA